MRTRFPAFLIIFIYECIRLPLGTECIAQLVFSASAPGKAAALALFAAPHVLFPLMAFFFWLDSARYGVYKTLYVAGKLSCSLCAALFALVLTYNTEGGMAAIVMELFLAPENGAYPLLGLALCLSLDVVAALFVFMFRKEKRR